MRSVLLAVALSGGACTPRASAEETVPSLTKVTIEDPATYWTKRGFVEMTPPIRLPSRDGIESIRVFLHVPEGGHVGRELGDASAPLLAYPAGTLAERIDLTRGGDPRSAADVRGTRFASDGQYFRVLQPIGKAGLDGFEWRRGDAAASALATEKMLAALEGSLRYPSTPQGYRALDLFARLNDCAECHQAERPERTRAVAESDGAPNRGTDAGGLFTIASVLSDNAPLERHRARDMNEDVPYVSVTCGDGNPASMAVHRGGAFRHYACGDGTVPRGRFDMVRALEAGDEHARDVCRSRRYLWEHMDGTVRTAFTPAFKECSLE